MTTRKTKAKTTEKEIITDKGAVTKMPIDKAKKEEDFSMKASIVDIKRKEKEEKNGGHTEWVVNTTKFNVDTPIAFRLNPKREGCQSWKRYEKYQVATTFGEYLELNAGKFSMADVRHDLAKEFLTLVLD